MLEVHFTNIHKEFKYSDFYPITTLSTLRSFTTTWQAFLSETHRVNVCRVFKLFHKLPLISSTVHFLPFMPIVILYLDLFP